MMPLLALSARSLLRSAARPGPAPRWIRSGPAQSPVSTGDTVLGFAAVFASVFLPAAWVLGHIQDYKKRDEDEEA
ncbi:cytochrome c oxidase subunit 8A, mitochondrial-like [Ammospiza caudacuta]|uniref:cytochrome c oxidase subunit 8A, mitochondrial-like n=1 Tax=Ammospiza caudacuta TaxID=2857398 RepID=UPI00273A0F3A|nr:cytochrome c oxidase subunit 8A, mitochondrial-like [Ammospiza caudacuta]